jgi:hypothetical protein
MVGVRGGNRRDVGRPRISGVSASVQTRRSCFPICHRYRSSGGSWPGDSGETSPCPGCLPASFPVSSATFPSSSRLLWVRVGWRPPSPPSRPHRVRQRAASGVSRRQGSAGTSTQTMPPSTRNCSLTRSLLHLASRAHSSCDDKEVIPCHPGHNRPDHRPHRR